MARRPCLRVQLHAGLVAQVQVLRAVGQLGVDGVGQLVQGGQRVWRRRATR